MNPLFECDAYKVGHREQYPDGTTEVFSNFTPRSSKLAPVDPRTGKPMDFVVPFGISAFVQELEEKFHRGFFTRDRDEVVSEYETFCKSLLGVPQFDVSHVRALHDLGYPPLEFRWLDEGTPVPIGVPIFTVVNTHPDFAWLTSYIEDMVSAQIWKPTTNATIAYLCRGILEDAARETGCSADFVQWQGHDFSLRGMSGMDDGMRCGAAHLACFMGTDCLPAFAYLDKYYNATDTFKGASCAATEHSVMCAGGEENEKETIRRIIQDVNPSGIVSVVSDTWDFFEVITNTAAELKDVILSRKTNSLGIAKVVFRPDSGDPADVLCGRPLFRAETIPYDFHDPEDVLEVLVVLYDDFVNTGTFFTGFDVEMTDGTYLSFDEVTNKEYDIKFRDRDDVEHYFFMYKLTREQFTAQHSREEFGALRCLEAGFGTTTNDAGYKTLHERVGLIYGDSITPERMYRILRRMKQMGFASNNVVFGIGSYTYQYSTRDCFGFAMKATNVIVNGVSRAIFKAPKAGGKNSSRGYLQVHRDGNGPYTLLQNCASPNGGCLKKNNFASLTQIRERVTAAINGIR